MKLSSMAYFSVFVEKRNRNHSSLSEKYHHDRHLENDAEGDQKPQGQGEILTH